MPDVCAKPNEAGYESERRGRYQTTSQKSTATRTDCDCWPMVWSQSRGIAEIGVACRGQNVLRRKAHRFGVHGCACCLLRACDISTEKRERPFVPLVFGALCRLETHRNGDGCVERASAPRRGVYAARWLTVTSGWSPSHRRRVSTTIRAVFAPVATCRRYRRPFDHG